MVDSGKKFMLFWDIAAGRRHYRWRLRNGTGESIAWSARGHNNKWECEEEIEFVKMEHPDAVVVDLTVARS